MTAAAIRARVGAVLLFALITAVHMIGLMMVVGAIAAVVFGAPVQEWSPEAKAWGLVLIAAAAAVIELLDRRDEQHEA